MGDGSEDGVECGWLRVSTCGRLTMIQRSVDGYSACEEPGEGGRKESEGTVCSLFRTTGRVKFVQVSNLEPSRDSSPLTKSERTGLPSVKFPLIHIIILGIFTTASPRSQPRPQT